MVMIIRSNIFQRTRLSVLNIIHKFRHFSAGCNVDLSFHMPVNSVVDHHIAHDPAQIDDLCQLFFNLRICMLHFEHTAYCCRLIDNIPPVRRDDIISGCPYKRYVLHDHLTAYVICRRQNFPRNRRRAVSDLIYNLFSSVRACHLTSSLTGCRFFIEMSSIGEECVKAPLEI